MICMPGARFWRHRIWPVCELLFEEFVRKPLRGLYDIAQGLELAVPELADALIDAIENQLSREARAKVQAGIDRIVQGWLLLRWPLGMFVLIVGFGWYGVAVIIIAGPMLAVVA
jgi:hypothetical protein